MEIEQKKDIVVTCAPGLNIALAHELEHKGYKIERSDPKAVTVKATFEEVMGLNYTLRCANRVLWPIARFGSIHPNHLYKNARKVPWEDYLKVDGYFSIDSFVQNKFIRDTRFANLKLKDAIADRFIEKSGKRPNTGPLKNEAVIFMHWKDEEVNLFLDTSGQTLAKHGYRKNPGGAPLMENLAAGIITESKWDKKSNFINPMCGSGTLAIEAALLALDIPPGRYREQFAFRHLANVPADAWEKVKKSLQIHEIPEQIDFKIIATDISRKAISIARENARYAGVEHLIEFYACKFERTVIPEGTGVVVMNPEYGERMGEVSDLEDTYRQMGDYMKQQCKGYTGYVFTGNMALAKKVGLRTSRRMPFFNGKLECRLLEYELF